MSEEVRGRREEITGKGEERNRVKGRSNDRWRNTTLTVSKVEGVGHTHVVDTQLIPGVA